MTTQLAPNPRMSRVRQRDTAPELVVRSLLHALDFRYRLHQRLPGRPDIVFPARRKVIFVHGCFWHGHNCKHGAVRSLTNTTFWDSKVTANRTRDVQVQQKLQQLGWRVITLWECELKEPEWIERLLYFLNDD
jgi:DNA mismatch endonuclease, patch repair protein